MHCNNGLNNKLVETLVENKIAEETGDLRYLQDSMYDFVKTLKEIILGEYSPEFFNKYVDEALKLHGSNLDEFLKIPKMGLELRQALNSIDDAIDTSNQEFKDNLVLLLDKFQTTLDNMEYEARDPYDTAVELGFTGTKQEWLEHLEGDSAYEIAVKNGYVGTQSEWLKYIRADGFIQSIQQFATNDAETKVQIPDYGTINSLQGYIKELFDNGGLPATPFATKALMTASSLVDGDYAHVTDDTVNNGMYVKTAGSWVKSTYDPVSQAVTDANLYTDNKTEFKIDGVLGKNLFDKSKVTDGKGLGDTGTIINASTRSVSDFIPVLPNTAYSFTSIRKACFYDASGNFVQLSFGALANVTTASNAVFMRLDVDTALLDVAQVELGSAKTAYETYGIYLTQQAFSKIQLNISKQQTDFITRSSPNLFASSTSTYGKSISTTTGEIYDRADTVASDFIPVFGSTVYSQTEGNFFAEYDANKVFIKGHLTGITTFTTDINTRFVRVAVRIVAIPIYILSRTDTPANYVPYDRWFLDDSIVVGGLSATSKWQGKTWNVMGDSITSDGNSYWRKVAADNEMITNNYGIGGTAIGVRAAPYDTNAMCVRYADMADNADLITIAGGTNDFVQIPLGSWDVRDNTTVYGAMRQMCEGLIAKYPAATIAGILPPQRYNAHVETYAYSFRKLIEALEECYHFYGIPTLDLSTELGFFRVYDPANKLLYTRNDDGLHPNALAHQRIAVTVAAWLETI